MDTTYEVRVRAKNADAPGPWSDTARVETSVVPAGPAEQTIGIEGTVRF